MTESVRDVVKDEIFQFMLPADDGFGQKDACVLADNILSLPSGLRAVRECNESTDYLRFNGKHPEWCRCSSTGLISRDIPISEAVEIPRMLIEDKISLVRAFSGTYILLPSGERVEVGKEIRA